MLKAPIAGWLETSNIPLACESLRLETDPRLRFALITALDSDRNVIGLLEERQAAGPPIGRRLGRAVVVEAMELLCLLLDANYFTGFDEVMFFREWPTQPPLSSIALTSEHPIYRRDIKIIQHWMANSGCSLALGDGDGLNFVTMHRELAVILAGVSGVSVRDLARWRTLES